MSKPKIKNFDELLERIEDGLGQRIQAGFEDVIGRIDGLTNRVDGVETRLGKVESRLGNVETRLGKVELGQAVLESDMREVKTRLGNIEDKIDANNAVYRTEFARHDKRITRLERKSGVAPAVA